MYRIRKMNSDMKERRIWELKTALLAAAFIFEATMTIIMLAEAMPLVICSSGSKHLCGLLIILLGFPLMIFLSWMTFNIADDVNDDRDKQFADIRKDERAKCEANFEAALKKYSKNISADKVMAEYEKEQKNEHTNT